MSRRDEVLRIALDLLDEVGLDALTTRRLAKRLGVQPGALYRHFDSKRDLLAAMVDHLVSGDEPLPATADWAHFLRTLAEGYRSRLLTRRDGARLVTTGLRPDSTEAQKMWEHCIAVMRTGGLSGDAAAQAVDTVLAYTNGFVIEEQARDGFPQPPAQRSRRDAGFRAGVDLILTGIDANVPSPRP